MAIAVEESQVEERDPMAHTLAKLGTVEPVLAHVPLRRYKLLDGA